MVAPPAGRAKTVMRHLVVQRGLLAGRRAVRRAVRDVGGPAGGRAGRRRCGQPRGDRLAPPSPRDALEGNGASEAAPEALRQAVGGGCRSGWGAVTVGYTCHGTGGPCSQGTGRHPNPRWSWGGLRWTSPWNTGALGRRAWGAGEDKLHVSLKTAGLYSAGSQCGFLCQRALGVNGRHTVSKLSVGDLLNGRTEDCE